MDHQSQLVTFSLTSSAARAWLVLTNDHRQSRVVEMQEERPTFWSTCTDLIPGEYRCRYYSGDERSVHYHGPATMDGKTFRTSIPAQRRAPFSVLPVRYR